MPMASTIAASGHPLRGRYGSRPTRLNVSKTGVSISTRNRLGALNWIKPGHSSAKLLGVQLRGRKAALLQGIYMAIAGVVAGAEKGGSP